MSSISEKEIWRRISRGDAKSFKTLYDTYIDDLLLFGQKLSNNNVIIEDTLQKLFLHIWDNRRSLKPPERTKAYLMKSLRNNLLREIRKEKVFSNIDIEEHLRDLEGVTVSADNTFLTSQIKSAINCLSERQREVIHLRYYQGIKNRDIADILGVNIQSVSNLLYRAISNIKASLEEKKNTKS